MGKSHILGLSTDWKTLYGVLTNLGRNIISILPQYPSGNTLFNTSFLSEMKNLTFVESVSKAAVVKIILLPYLPGAFSKGGLVVQGSIESSDPTWEVFSSF